MNIRRLLIAGLLMLPLMLVATGTVSAQEPDGTEPEEVLEGPVPIIIVDFEDSTQVGENIVIAAYLQDPAGNPIAGEFITFYLDMDFMNTLGQMGIGNDVTDSTGLAFTTYEAKVVGERNVTARFGGNVVFLPAEAAAPISIAPGPATYEEEIPFRIPGANVWMIVLALGVTWSIFLGVTWIIVLIGRSGSQPHTGAGASR